MSITAKEAILSAEHLKVEELKAESNPMQKLIDFLAELDKRHIFYTLGQAQYDGVMVDISVPGQRWEVEFFADGSVEVEIFSSDGKIRQEEAITELFEKFSD